MPQRAESDFNAMRQDAIRRSREMHRRAMPPPPPRPEPPEPPAPPPEPPRPDLPPPPPPPKPPGADGLLGDLHLSDTLHALLTEWDGEKLALAGLLYLLYKEGADPALLLALAYVLL